MERAKIAARLAEGYTVAQLFEAIDGCLAAPFKNDKGKTFDGLELIVRDSAKVEQFRAQADGGEGVHQNGRESAEEFAKRQLRGELLDGELPYSWTPEQETALRVRYGIPAPAKAANAP